MPTTSFRIPDLETIFVPLAKGVDSDKICPHYEIVLPEARAWISQYQDNVYGPKMTMYMDRCKIELLAAYLFPYATRSQLRAMMDLYNLFWIYDEVTDVQSGEEGRQTAKPVREIFSNPSLQDGSWLCSILQDFRQRHLDNTMSSAFVERFIGHFCMYTDMVAEEAFHREEHRVLDIPRYILFRRETAAVRVVMDSVEYCCGIELSTKVLSDPVFEMAYNAALDIASLTNDAHTYNMEQAREHHEANFISVIMKERGVDVQDAMDYCGGYCEALTGQFLDCKRRIFERSAQSDRQSVMRILDAYGIWLRGHTRWGFATESFFGLKGEEIRLTRQVVLRAPHEEHVNIVD